MSRDWDAATYDRVSSPQVAMAGAVLDRLDLRGDETVLDAGCGSGRVTLMLLERLPRGDVVAVDQAPSMVEHARGTQTRGSSPTPSRRTTPRTTCPRSAWATTSSAPGGPPRRLVEAVLARAGHALDYVRLNITARRASRS